MYPFIVYVCSCTTLQYGLIDVKSACIVWQLFKISFRYWIYFEILALLHFNVHWRTLCRNDLNTRLTCHVFVFNIGLRCKIDTDVCCMVSFLYLGISNRFQMFVLFISNNHWVTRHLNNLNISVSFQVIPLTICLSDVEWEFLTAFHIIFGGSNLFEIFPLFISMFIE